MYRNSLFLHSTVNVEHNGTLSARHIRQMQAVELDVHDKYRQYVSSSTWRIIRTKVLQNETAVSQELYHPLLILPLKPYVSLSDTLCSSCGAQRLINVSFVDFTNLSNYDVIYFLSVQGKNSLHRVGFLKSSFCVARDSGYSALQAGSRFYQILFRDVITDHCESYHWKAR